MATRKEKTVRLFLSFSPNVDKTMLRKKVLQSFKKSFHNSILNRNELEFSTVSLYIRTLLFVRLLCEFCDNKWSVPVLRNWYNH